jgi:hypothetical protein
MTAPIDPEVPALPPTPNNAGGLWVWTGTALEPVPDIAPDPLPSDDE